MSLTTLNGAINSSVTTATVHDTITNPAAPFFALIGTEIVRVTAVSTTSWTITRAQYETTAASHGDTTKVFQITQVAPAAQGVTVSYISDAGVQVTTFIQTYPSSAQIIVPPSSDPHVVGAIWNNAGTLTISSG